MMLNLENGSNFTIEDIEVGPPSPGTYKNTKVTLTVKTPVAKNHQIPYSGTLTFEYNRLLVPIHFDGVLGGYSQQLPTSSQILLNEITNRVGQRFVLDDFVLEDIGRHNASAYVLRAKSESLRWRGSMVVRLGDIADLENALGALMPDTLGQLDDSNLFNTVNLSAPHLNATPHMADIEAMTVGLSAQFDPKIEPIFNAMVAMTETPGYRVPLHKNTRFEQAGTGWTVTHTGPGASTFLNQRANLYFFSDVHAVASDIFTISRPLALAGNTILEVTFHVDEFRAIDEAATSAHFTARLSTSVGVDVDDCTVTVTGPGTYHCFLTVPSTGTFTVALDVESTNRVVALSELTWRSFPHQWAMDGTFDLTADTYDSTDPTVLSLVNGVLTCGGESVDPLPTIDCQVDLVQDRSYLVTFDVVQPGDGDILFCALGSTEIWYLGEFNSVAHNHVVGQRRHVVLNVPKEMSQVWRLCIVTTAPGAVVTKVKNIRFSALPLLHAENAMMNYDFSGIDADYFPTSEFGADPTPDPADGNVALLGGFLTVFVENDRGLGLRFLSKALHPRERYTLMIEAPAAAYLEPTDPERYVGVRVEQNDAVMYHHTTSGVLTWNPTLEPRFQTPALVKIVGQVNTVSPAANLRISLNGYTYATGIATPYPFRTSYARVSVEVTYPTWIIDAGLTRRNLYNATLLQANVSLGVPLNSVRPLLLKAARFNLDVEYSREFSSGEVLFPFMPLTEIRNRFQPISQFFRFGVATAEDVSPYRNVIDQLTAPMVINAGNFPTTMISDVTQPTPWTVSTLPGVKNLNGATVQYNGTIRDVDPVPMNPGLTQVLVLFLHPTFCTGYKGQIRFYYNGRYPA